jgi:uncharacterized protein
MNFVWDPAKARSNLTKHAVSFEEASTVFVDMLSATGSDPDHSQMQERWLTLGCSSQGNFLVVSHTDQEDIVRIISDRAGTKHERKLYEEN